MSGCRRSGWASTTASFCVGCCWSLMLLMFAVGVGNIGVMLLLGARYGGREEHAVGTTAERAAGS